MTELADTADMTDADPLEHSIRRATEALLARQNADGHWVFELEADCTIPAQYVLLQHYLGDEIEPPLEAKIGVYLRRIQGAHGGWPLFQDGDFDISASVMAYFALKMIGDLPDAEHMRRAREAIRAHGGAGQSNVFTRFMLALYGVVSWRAVPVMPVEIMLLPRWSPFTLAKISYWSRTSIAPMLVLQALKPKAHNARGVGIDELFIEPPQMLGPPHKSPHQKASWFLLFRAIDEMLRLVEPLLPKRQRRRAIDKAVDFIVARLNGEDGIGAIFPPMAYSLMMFGALGLPRDHPHCVISRAAIDKLLVVKADEAYCQPCVSPIWDTGLVCHTLLEAGGKAATERVARALQWLAPRQVLDLAGDWAEARPSVRPGGWAFQYANAYYPDVDDTAVVIMAMDRAEGGGRQYQNAITRAREWIIGMQSKNGGWGAFDADNDYQYLNNIPFADHGALLDPPTEDVSARCVSMLAQIGDRAENSPALARAIDYLRQTQLDDGSWYGRWGMNYIYGTWSVLCALNAVGRRPAGSGNTQGRQLAHRHPESRRRLGRGRIELQARLQRLRAGAKHRIADRLGTARADGHRRRRSPGGRARPRLSHAQPKRRRPMGGGALYRDRLPARVLFALPRLCQIFPAVGARALPQFEKGE